MDYKDIIVSYNSNNSIPNGNIKKPYIILLDGVIGSGKSTVINYLKNLMDVQVLSNDRIRNYLTTMLPNIDFNTREDLVKEIRYPRMKEILDKHNICVLDGDISGNFDEKISKIKEMGYPYYIVRLCCDKEINSKRVRNRKIELNDGTYLEDRNYSLADHSEYLFEASRKRVLDSDLIFYEIDTSGSLESIKRQVESLVCKLLSLDNEVISLDKSRYTYDDKYFIKESSNEEYENLLKIKEVLNNKTIFIDKEYVFKIPNVYSYNNNKVTMEYCNGINLELMLRDSDTHKEAVLILNSVLRYLIDNNIYWYSFSPRNILINDNQIVLVDFERKLDFTETSLTDYFKDIVYEEYAAFLTDDERIIKEKDIYSDTLEEPIKKSKRVLAIKEYSNKSYYEILREILKLEQPYLDNYGNQVYPLVYLENLLIQKGYNEYAKYILGGFNMRKEYKPFSNVKGFYLNEKFFESDTGLKLELRDGGFIPKSGLIYNTVLGDVEGKKVLDLGCGDLGILGVLARENGAKEIESVDIDLECVNWFNKLIRDNNFTNMNCYYSDNFSNVNSTYDAILTNLAQMPMINGKTHDTGGYDGRDNIIEILKNARNYLIDGGYLYMLLFDFLGIDKRTSDEKSISEIAKEDGYQGMEILESVDKIIKPGSVTYDSISHILDVYPNYTFNETEEGNKTCKVLIARFKK